MKQPIFFWIAFFAVGLGLFLFFSISLYSFSKLDKLRASDATNLLVIVTYSDHTTNTFTIPSNLASKDDIRYDLLRWNSMNSGSCKQITSVEINEKQAYYRTNEN